MKQLFQTDITRIVNEIGGNTFYYKSDQCFNIRIEFGDMNYMVFDYLKLKSSKKEPDYGIILRSEVLTGKRYVSIYEYTYHLINWLQSEFNKTILMKPFTAHIYFNGQNKLNNNQILN